MGSPSMYFDFPFASCGTRATVALKRASRAIPAQMKKVRKSVSTGVRSPMQKARIAGATPNEIYRRAQRTVSMTWCIRREGTHGIGQTVQLLTKHAALVSPSRDLSVEYVEEHSHERVKEGPPLDRSENAKCQK